MNPTQPSPTITNSIQKLSVVSIFSLLVVLGFFAIVIIWYEGRKAPSVTNNDIIAQTSPTGKPGAPTQLPPAQMSPTPAVSSRLVDVDSQWSKYINSKIGFSVKVPKTALSYYGDCTYSTENGDHSYRPVNKIIPIQVLESAQDVFLAGSYYYELTNPTEEDSRTFFASCNKVNITTDTILNLPQNGSIGPNLRFYTRTATTDQELEQFIKDIYGKGCMIGSKELSKQSGVYSVSIDPGEASEPSIDSPFNPDCVLNFMHSVLYSPAQKLVIAYNLGQACNFAYPSPEMCLDKELADSVTFE